MISYPNPPLSRKVVIAGAPGIPRQLVELRDAIFEGLPQDVRQDWPERFYTALPEGADLSGVWPPFAVWLLREVVSPVAGVNQTVVERVARGIETNWAHDDWNAAEASASASPGDAAQLAVWAAAAAVAGNAGGFATKAVWTVAESAEAAAEAARTAAEFAAWAAADTTWTRMADKLCELMAACGKTVA